MFDSYECVNISWKRWKKTLEISKRCMRVTIMHTRWKNLIRFDAFSIRLIPSCILSKDRVSLGRYLDHIEKRAQRMNSEGGGAGLSGKGRKKHGRVFRNEGSRY